MVADVDQPRFSAVNITVPCIPLVIIVFTAH